MPEVNNVSPVLPVAAATPVQNSANNAAVSQGDGSNPAFSQVLRDKQAAANSSGDATNTAAKNKTASSDSKADPAQKDDSDVDNTARTPAEMAQMLAAAGLQLSANTQQTATAANADGAAEQLAIDASSKTGNDAGVMSLLTKTDKTAASGAATTASLAGPATGTSSTDQALSTQSQLAAADKKGGQSSTSNGDQSADKQPLIAVGQSDGDKSHADTKVAEATFAATLDSAAQSAEAARNGLVQASNISQTQSTQAPPTVHVVETPVGRQGWADDVGQRVLWTAKSDSSRADLVLTPPQLGRIEVSIHMNGDQANASFMVANPIAREALQDAMPKLRELMSQAGIQLGQADVSAGQSGQSNAQGERYQSGGGGGRNTGGGILGSDSMVGATTGNWTRRGTGMVDTFA